mmetsp:Transcript_39441/g.92740  ORF Transcript_39441/g.92740 Transcript_39441/m.92740 type:complete len:128 (-) Transcript_39441:282-665(-)
MRDMREEPFSDFLRRELSEQAERGNARILPVLQAIVQRATLAAEGVLEESPEAARRLSAMLQMSERDQRAAYWRDVVCNMGAAGRDAFDQAVLDAYADVDEKRRNGVRVDQAMVRQIQLVRDELDEY